VSLLKGNGFNILRPGPSSETEALLLQGFFVACDSHQKKQTDAACCDISIYIVVGSILQTDCSANDNDQASPYIIGRQ
jgi:hypothetical protein